MKYLCHTKYYKVGACNEEILVNLWENVESIGNFIAKGSKAICAVNSYDAFRYFARNDDGNGKQRGTLTYKIAFAPRHPNKNNGYRFTEDEIEMLEKDYSKFLVKDSDVILFNYDFFNADIEELEGLYKRLEVA